MRDISLTSSSPLYCIFEDDALPSSRYEESTMQRVLDELLSTVDDFDIAYLGSIQWFQLLPWMPPWHRVTLHTLDYAWSTMHANIYSRHGIANVLSVLEPRLAALESDPNSEPEHVDLYLEHNAPSIVRRQVVPYMFDQDWSIPSGNVDRCEAEAIDCSNDQQAWEQQYLREGRHVQWSDACFEVGGYPVRFYLILIPSLLIGLWIPLYCCFRCYKTRRCCFAKSLPQKDQPKSEATALLVKH